MPRIDISELLQQVEENTITEIDLRRPVNPPAILTQAPPAPIRSLQILPDDNLIGISDNKLTIWDIETGKQLQRLKSPITAFAISPNNVIFSASYNDGTTTLLASHLKTKQRIFTETYSDCITALFVLPNGNVVLGFYTGVIKILSPNLKTSIATFSEHTSPICYFAMLKDDSLISGAQDGIIKIWDLNTLTCSNTLIGHTSEIVGITPTDDLYIASASVDGTICIWYPFVEQKQLFPSDTFKASAPITSFIRTPAGSFISANTNQTLEIWNNPPYDETIKPRLSDPNIGLTVSSLVVSRDGSLIFASTEGIIKTWPLYFLDKRQVFNLLKVLAFNTSLTTIVWGLTFINMQDKMRIQMLVDRNKALSPADALKIRSQAPTPFHRLIAQVQKQHPIVPIPTHLLCPIFGLIMLEPVITSSGHTYEKEAILEHFETRRAKGLSLTNPTTNEIITDVLIPNWSIRNAIDDFLVKFPEYKNQQYTPKPPVSASSAPDTATTPPVSVTSTFHASSPSAPKTYRSSISEVSFIYDPTAGNIRISNNDLFLKNLEQLAPEFIAHYLALFPLYQKHPIPISGRQPIVNELQCVLLSCGLSYTDISINSSRDPLYSLPPDWTKTPSSFHWPWETKPKDLRTKAQKATDAVTKILQDTFYTTLEEVTSQMPPLSRTQPAVEIPIIPSAPLLVEEGSSSGSSSSATERPPNPNCFFSERTRSKLPAPRRPYDSDDEQSEETWSQRMKHAPL